MNDTSVKECVSVSSNNDVNSFHTLGNVSIHIKTRVAQCNDLIVAQGFQFINLNLKLLHLIHKRKVLP